MLVVGNTHGYDVPLSMAVRNGGVVANRCFGVKCKFELKETGWARVGSISKTTWEALEVALVGNVALNGSGFGGVG